MVRAGGLVTLTTLVLAHIDVVVIVLHCVVVFVISGGLQIKEIGFLITNLNNKITRIQIAYIALFLVIAGLRISWFAVLGSLVLLFVSRSRVSGLVSIGNNSCDDGEENDSDLFCYRY